MTIASGQPWATGTIEDEFTPIYLALARDGKYHRAMTSPEVDATDLSTIAAYMGIGEQQQRLKSAFLNAQGAPDVAMVPKSRTPPEP